MWKHSLRRKWKVFADSLELMYDTKEFGLAIVGFGIYQYCAHVLAYYAGQHNLLTDMVVRCFFMIIQLILLLIFESRLHFFQHKWLLLTIANASLIFCGMEMNPFYTFAMLYVITWPYFYRVEKSLEKEIDKAFEEDPHLENYVHKT